MVALAHSSRDHLKNSIAAFKRCASDETDNAAVGYGMICRFDCDRRGAIDATLQIFHRTRAQGRHDHARPVSPRLGGLASRSAVDPRLGIDGLQPRLDAHARRLPFGRRHMRTLVPQPHAVGDPIETLVLAGTN